MADYDSAMPVRGNQVDGAAVDSFNQGLVIMGNDGSNYQDIKVNSSGELVLAADITVAIDKANDSIAIWSNTAKDGTGTDYQPIVDVDGHLQVDVLSGSGGTQYAEDTAHTTGDTGTMSLVVRNDTLASLVTTDGDYAPLQVNATGALYTEISSALPAGTNNIGDVDIASALPAGANSIGTVGLDTGSNTVGKVYITDGSNDLSVANDGTAQVTYGVEIMGTDGANNRTLKTDSTGQLFVVQSSASLTETTTYATANLVKDTGTTVASYSPSSGTDQIGGFIVSGSGLMKVEIQWGTTASETTQIVMFNSTANPNVVYNFPHNMQHNLASTETIIVRATNLENSASPASDFSGYATILSAQ